MSQILYSKKDGYTLHLGSLDLEKLQKIMQSSEENIHPAFREKLLNEIRREAN